MQMKSKMVSMAVAAGLGRQRLTARMRQPWMNCSMRPADSLALGESHTLLVMNCAGPIRMRLLGCQIMTNAGLCPRASFCKRLPAVEHPYTANQKGPVA